jgi:hypothetical protein
METSWRHKGNKIYERPMSKSFLEQAARGHKKWRHSGCVSVNSSLFVTKNLCVLGFYYKKFKHGKAVPQEDEIQYLKQLLLAQKKNRFLRISCI